MVDAMRQIYAQGNRNYLNLSSKEMEVSLQPIIRCVNQKNNHWSKIEVVHIEDESICNFQVFFDGSMLDCQDALSYQFDQHIRWMDELILNQINKDEKFKEKMLNPLCEHRIGQKMDFFSLSKENNEIIYRMESNWATRQDFWFSHTLENIRLVEAVQDFLQTLREKYKPCHILATECLRNLCEYLELEVQNGTVTSAAAIVFNEKRGYINSADTSAPPELLREINTLFAEMAPQNQKLCSPNQHLPFSNNGSIKFVAKFANRTPEVHFLLPVITTYRYAYRFPPICIGDWKKKMLATIS